MSRLEGGQKKVKSIVAQTAIYSAVFSALACGMVFYVLFKIQENIHREGLINDTQENIKKSTSFILEYFYIQGNWVHLQEHQKYFSEAPNILYTYIVNPNGKIDVGRVGMQSPDVGKEKFDWEPQISSDLMESVRTKFIATPELADEYTNRVKVGDTVGFIVSPIKCSSGKNDCGQLRVAITFETIKETMNNLKWILVAAGILISLLTVFIVFLVTRSRLMPIRKMSEKLRTVASQSGVASGISDFESNIVDAEETRYFKESFNLFAKAYERATNLENEVKVNRTMTSMAKQVAHDIRSPLAALDALASVITEVSEEKRLLLRSAIMRIRDIANNLISFYSRKSADEDLVVGKILVSGLLTEMISEKRLQYRQHSSIHIEEKYDDNMRGVFIEIGRNEIQRALSNIVNNAIESLPSQSGRVVIAARLDGANVYISIVDDGVGIDGSILPKLLEGGGSYNKSGGLGLGLHHARKVVSDVGGRLTLTSAGVGKGSTVEIVLPVKESPQWFAKSLSIPRGAHVLILDDDESIHQIWRQKLTSEVCKVNDLTVHHFHDAQVFEKEAADLLTNNRGRIQCFIDYELIGSRTNGVQTIENIGAQYCSTLITSHYEDLLVQQECLRLGLRMIPKENVAKAPIEFVEKSSQVNIHCVLIDDDIWIREAWELKAKQAGKTILSLSHPKELESHLGRLAKAVPIFVDYHFGTGGDTGVGIARKLKDLGYERIYFQTGLSPEQVAERDLVVEVTGKVPPDWLFE